MSRYEAYLQSPEWRERRTQALVAARWRCSSCGAGHAVHYGRSEMAHRVPWLEVHHLSYERLGAELPEDLAVLCGRCHGEHHAAEGFRRMQASAPLDVREMLARLLER